MVKRAAVLDLGTNTYQLLIAERVGGNISFVHRDERWVNMAEDGIDRIGEAAFSRMTQVLTEYRAVIKQHKPDAIQATGTAAFRAASNSGDAIALVENLIGVTPVVLNGDDEARLIYEGMRCVTNPVNGTVLTMDIGGGSTEFIIGRGEKLLWKKSYPLGATLLKRLFHKTEPIGPHDANALVEHVRSSLKDLQTEITLHQPSALIGTSGSFDSFAAMLFHGQTVSENALVEIDRDALNGLVERLKMADEQTRKTMPGLVWFRVGPIVAAALLTQSVINQFNVQKIYRSPFALKEGLMRRLFD